MAHKKGVGSSRNGRDSNPKMLGVKRYGGEGGESAMVFYNELFKLAAEGNMLSLSNRQSSYILQQATAITIMMYASRESSVCPHYFVSL